MAIPVLEQAAAQLRERLGSIPGVVVEHKRFGVAVHYRNAARDRVGDVAAAVRTAGQRDALRVTTGREVIELRPDIDWDKGKTLRWVIEHLRSRTAPRQLPWCRSTWVMTSPTKTRSTPSGPTGCRSWCGTTKMVTGPRRRCSHSTVRRGSPSSPRGWPVS
ncbi:trehalose-phosphatase [Mycobacterium kansasii]|uniref:Trehalose 6-phosphate phosphatase n=1 Tax=Mycobacterium kansasii TaxID=1768 RepID=A0A1V3WL90_MYCKA|nr:trehalose-phosphatase [Mycobacterium kansasii]